MQGNRNGQKFVPGPGQYWVGVQKKNKKLKKKKETDEGRKKKIITTTLSNM